MSSAVITQLYSGLACHGHDFEVTPDLAAGWVVRDDGRRYIVHLRHDGTWNDGEPVTAHDFDAGWKSTLDPATGSAHAQLLYDIRGARDYHTGKSCDPDTLGIRAIDDFTLEVELEAPAPYFPHLLAHPATLPQPRHAFQGRPAGGEVLSECISNGPFMVDEWEHGRRMHLVRNPRYHGRWHGNLEGVTLELDIPPAEALRRYDADELDVVRLSSDSTMQELVHVQRNYAGEFLSGPRLATWQLGFDTSRPPFDDARVRRAFALTCDRERLANGLLKGLFTPATGGFVPPGMPGHTPNTALPFDPVEGRRLLAEAGYAGGTGFPHVTLWTDQWAADVIDAMAAEWWRLLNIGVETRSLPWGEFVQRMEREPVQMYYSAWRADYPDPDSFLRSGLRWHATQWHDPAYEELLHRAQLALNSADRLRSYRDAEEHLVRSAGIVPVAYGRLYLIMKPRVRRYRFSGIRPWFLSDVVIDD